MLQVMVYQQKAPESKEFFDEKLTFGSSIVKFSITVLTEGKEFCNLN